VHSAKTRPSDCARRNLRSLRDGARGFNAGGIADRQGIGHAGAVSRSQLSSFPSVSSWTPGVEVCRIVACARPYPLDAVFVVDTHLAAASFWWDQQSNGVALVQVWGDLITAFLFGVRASIEFQPQMRGTLTPTLKILQ
jgi:hypothetical protein